MFTGATVRHARRHRRLVALLLFAWLNLLVQPCQAGLPARPAAVEHCDHAGNPDHRAPCAAMQATACESSTDLNAGTAQATAPSPVGALLVLLPVDPAGAIAAVRDQGDPTRATGPPLNIRFCNLRN